MLHDKFNELVVKALAGLPQEFKELLDNIDIVVEDWPSKRQIRQMKLRNRYGLLGLYEGIPITKRDQAYNLVAPDKITIFQSPIESQYKNDDEITMVVQRVVVHEIAHHFGFDEQSLRRIEAEDRSRKDR
jgi:predicted Zn-dependent protease with MMP-like domain